MTKLTSHGVTRDRAGNIEPNTVFVHVNGQQIGTLEIDPAGNVLWTDALTAETKLIQSARACDQCEKPQEVR